MIGLIYSLFVLVALSFAASTAVLCLATYHTLRCRDIDAGIVGILTTAGMAIATMCAVSILVTL